MNHKKPCAYVFCKTRSHWVHTNIISLAPEHRWHEYVDSLLVTCLTEEYPPAFSAALAGAVADCFLGPLQAPEIEAWVQEALQACAHIRTEAQWLPDFQG
ncbi:unnamed protein product [Cladocopium goreaui]|uniref:Uncharacterized protein n=1 Tax=Cladocopium goreaui TaxID=2562237 RepID=A0A9P1DVN8_9DINO|nr:unnamed protein product [Cladocopium goreaui]